MKLPLFIWTGVVAAPTWITHINYSRTVGNISSWTIAKPTDTADWDIMFMYTVRQNGFVTAPAWWISLWDSISSGIYHRLYYKVASSEPSSYSWTGGGTNRTHISINTYRWAFDTADPIDASSNIAYTTSSVYCRWASVNVTSADSVLLQFSWVFNFDATLSYTKPTAPEDNWTEDYDYYDFTADCAMAVFHWTYSWTWATWDVDSTMSLTKWSTKHAYLVALNPE